MAKKFETELIERPGLYYSDSQLATLVAELRAVAASCFDEVPSYQCLEGSRRELADKVICLARDARGEAVGFCSAVVLPVIGVGDVLHLGLTCVDPRARGDGLTRRLTARLVVSYLLRHGLLSKIWISNVACVLSSLGNVALAFDGVYPSPFTKRGPSDQHRRIANAVDRHYRRKVFIDEAARFDDVAFVFRGSVYGTCFQKRADDTRFHHRAEPLNRYYAEIMCFDQGDEVLQVGHFSLLSVLRYALGLRRKPEKLRRLLSAPEGPKRLPQPGA